MLPTRILPIQDNNPLWISWHDSNWIPILNPQNVMDYFAEKSNPFYDRTCNNEIIKMQRQSLEQLNNMVGVEYILLHVQDPILYVIRKQHRHNPTSAVPLADYYIIAGTVYQAPDLASVFNSRLLSSVHHLQSAFEEASSYSKYHPNKGYTFDFSSNKAVADKVKVETKKEVPKKEEPSSIFQRQRVDMLLADLLRKFPPTSLQTQPQSATTSSDNKKAEGVSNIKAETPVDNNIKSEQTQSETLSQTESLGQDSDVKSEMKPPPEKKMKF